MAINCAAIPENLLESELFGHEKGAFTGAAGRKIGKIEAANGGTLMLDEIGDMPMALQAKILRFLQERTIERLGSTNEISVDVWVVSATHRDITAMIAEGGFREDLYFRIGEITLKLPPLRERQGDVPLLAREMLHRHAGDRRVQLSKEAVAAMEGWPWPGNIRELENRVKRACIMAESHFITPQDLELVNETDAPPLNLKEVRANAKV
jgi:two-component system NtrC family response regulator